MHPQRPGVITGMKIAILGIVSLALAAASFWYLNRHAKYEVDLGPLTFSNDVAPIVHAKCSVATLQVNQRRSVF